MGSGFQGEGDTGERQGGGRDTVLPRCSHDFSVALCLCEKNDRTRRPTGRLRCRLPLSFDHGKGLSRRHGDTEMDDKEKGTLFFPRLDGLLGGCGALFRQAPSAGYPCRASGSRAPLKEEEGTLFFCVALMISPWLCVSVRETIERGCQPDACGAGCLRRSTAGKVSHGGTETRREREGMEKGTLFFPRCATRVAENLVQQ
jgi:hypothetical protein